MGVRFNLIDIDKKGKEVVKLRTTTGAQKIEQTVSSVLGSKFLHGMSPITVDFSKIIQQEGNWSLNGLVSKAGDVIARESQFFSINDRPVELPKISRILSEVWRSLGLKKRPACIFRLNLPNSTFDVNLSPDKRQVLLTEEERICELIQAAVMDLWNGQRDGKFIQGGVAMPSSNSKTSAQKRENPSAISNSVVKEVPVQSAPTKGRARQTESLNEPEKGLDSSAPIANGKVPSDHSESNNEPNTLASKMDPPKRKASNPYRKTAPDALPSAQSESNNEPHEDAQRSNAPSKRSAPNPNKKTGKVNSACDDHGSGNKPSEQSLQEGKAPVCTPPSPSFAKIPQSKTTASKTTAALQHKEISPVADKDLASAEANAQSTTNQTVRIKSSLASEEKVSDKEKQQWAEVQQRFRQQDRSQQNEILSLHHPITPEARKESTDESPKKKKWTLEDYAFTPVEKNTRERTKRQRSVPEIDAQNPPQRKRQSQGTTKSVTNGSSVQTSYASAASKVQRESSQKPKNSVIRSALPNSSLQRALSAANDDESDSDSVPDEVIWTSFKGTSEIVATSRKRRLELEKQRQELRAVRRRRLESSEEGASGEDDQINLNKEDFDKMEVIGQFNLGFILAKCEKNHLWIMDQHACDEKYNFERLCNTTVIHEQKLLAPMPLELSPSEETCVLDHMEIFEKNGFRFNYEADKAPRHRLSLTALPHSGARDGRKGVQFGKEDVSALCAILGVTDGSAFSQDGGTGVSGDGMYGNNAVRRYAGNSSQLTQQQDEKAIARLPKTIAMFANRACRGSIMIGTALSRKEMEDILDRLKGVDHPWNCPHGRPTMRHVSDVLSGVLDDAKRSLGRIALATTSVMPTTQLTQDEG